jgi:endoglucanase
VTTRTTSIHSVLRAAAMATLVLMAAQAAARGEPAFRRGIGISDAMEWAQIAPGPAQDFVFPPFSDDSHALTADELRTLRQTGFDFVRLAVDPGPFLQFQGARRDAVDRILMERVRLILGSGLAVVVDFHPSDMHPAYVAEKLTGGVTTAEFQAYVRLLERTAGLLDGLHSDRVALELMNEPPSQPQAWQPMLEAAYAAVRRRSTKLLVVVEGGDEASAAALMAMRTDPLAADPAALFAFHYYDPYQFTHQGAAWNAARYLADVPYPARARPLADSLAATAALIAASDLPEPRKAAAGRDARERLESYWQSDFDDRTVTARFRQVADWGRARGIAPERIMLGEFGARKTALQAEGVRAAERAQWFHDVSRAAQAEGFGWAVWTYRPEGQFGLVRSDTSGEFDPAIADALGLRAHPRADAVPAGPNAAGSVR